MRSRAVLLVGWVVALLFVVLARDAAALPVGFALTGTVSLVNDTANVFGGVFSVGMPFTATVEYETTLPDIEPDPAIGRYTENPASLMRITMSLGGVDITTSTTTSEAINLVRSDTNLFIAQINEPLSTGPEINVMRFQLSSTDPSAITTDALPTVLDLAGFDATAEMSLAVGPFPFAAVFAEIQTLVPLPEPGTGMLMGLGVGLLVAQGRASRFRTSA